MKKALAAAVVIFACAHAPAGEWTLGIAPAAYLPGGATRADGAAAAALNVGRALDGFWAVEAEALAAPAVSMPGKDDAICGASLRGRWHLAGWDAFDRLFGCERFDPFVVFGAGADFSPRPVFDRGARRTAIGPVVGVGAFWHLSDAWALRFDAASLWACGETVSPRFALGLGVVRAFGGGGAP